MDLIKQLGAMAFGTRLRLLTDVFIQDAVKIYREQNIDFEPRWFPVFYLLIEKAPLTITEIASELSYTQPAVTQIADILIDKNLVKIIKHKLDTRKKMLALSRKGINLIPVLKPIWESFDNAINDIFGSTGYDILFVIEKLEDVINEKSIYARVKEIIKQKQGREADIINYNSKYKKYFRDLNYEWLKKYFKVEKPDKIILNDPDKYIIKRGGSIFFAKLMGEIVGTCALLKHDSKTYELAKMAVTEKARGRQIGKMLAQTAINKARSKKAKVLFLETNQNLIPANKLYKQLGFVQTESAILSKYERATIKMELKFPNQ